MALVAGAGAALAGPPLTTEDPGILDPGQLELIVAATVSATDSGKTQELPVFDLSLGIHQALQLSAALPYVRSDPDAGPADSDFGNLQLGLKWRFLDTDRAQLAFAPLYAFGVSVTKEITGLGHGNDVLLLPLTAELALGGDWRLTADAGYGIVRGDRDGLGYGAYLGRPLGRRANVYLELHGSAERDFSDDFMHVALGADWRLATGLLLLVSIGTGLWEPAGAEATNYRAYLGLQYLR